MIEKYFRTGVRFKWTKPRDAVGGASDGAIVDSLQPAAPLIYDGLDGEVLDPTFRIQHVSTFGFVTRMPIHHAWLDYAPGRTARLPIGPYDVLTGYMSGCVLTYWEERGVRYVGHIGTIDNNNHVNNLVRRTFAFRMSRSCKGFNPAGAWGMVDIQQALGKYAANAKIFGLVTTGGVFYSVLLGMIDQMNWVVGGMRQVPPMMHDQLKMRLLRFEV